MGRWAAFDKILLHLGAGSGDDITQLSYVEFRHRQPRRVPSAASPSIRLLYDTAGVLQGVTARRDLRFGPSRPSHPTRQRKLGAFASIVLQSNPDIQWLKTYCLTSVIFTFGL